MAGIGRGRRRPLIKTYTFKRGSYAIGVKHEVVNASGAPAALQPMCNWCAGGYAGRQRALAPTPTGPALYTDKGSSKPEFGTSRRASWTSRSPPATAGWPWCSTTSPRPGYGGDAKREFFANKVAGTAAPPTRWACSTACPNWRPAPALRREDILFAGPQEENKLAALAPGLELVKDYGIFSIPSKPLFWLLDKLHGILGNWGWGHRGAGHCCSRSPSTGSMPAPTAAWPR